MITFIPGLLAFISIFICKRKTGGGEVDSKKIKSAYRALLKAAENNISQEDIPRIRAALDLAIKTGEGSVALTGEPQVLHALSVARIIAGEVGLGPTSIITALLHDSW
ncbi:MAG TPA: hypothetical protein PLO24_09300, partial [Bacteroidales bacterium]|nr:hypothetical protein [Bacteroidales bacterium]